MKRFNCIFLLLLLTSLGAGAQTLSEWMLHLRGADQYMYGNGNQLHTSKTAFSSCFTWIIESTDSEAVRIRNKGLGTYLQLTENEVQLAPLTSKADSSFIWSFQGFVYRNMANCGWYTLSNAQSGKPGYLTARNGSLQYLPTDRTKDFDAHWTPVRMNGNSLPYSLHSDGVTDNAFTGIRTSKAISDIEMTSDYHGPKSWKLTKDISSFPSLSIEGNTLIPALYNMAIEEMLLDVRKDSTYMAGALWPDTWTRDAVYSIYFAYAWVMPEVSRRTLEKQTMKNPSEALQDTGTGGSWPISTDRVVWAMAAWEYYLVTGDRNWLKEAYEGLKYTALKDLHVAFDSNVNLFKGETCSMDWRTHTYPNWFSNSTIGESYSSGTNSLHFFLYRFLADAGALLKEPADELSVWTSTRDKLKQGINARFWNSEKGLYNCYLYPEFIGYLPTQRIGVMSNGLAAILGVASAEQQASVVKNFPMYPYGAAVLYPSIPDDYAYHNKSVWPVWQTPLMYAARNTGNTAAANHLMQTLVRASAMFLTHKENMTYDTGYDRNTALNSDRQLWSVASYISMVYRILFGMELTPEGVTFRPVVPHWISGTMTLNNFKYRNARLNLTVKGQGNKITSLTVNGKPQRTNYLLPATAKGTYDIVITMTQETGHKNEIHLVAAGPGNCWSPVEPVIRLENQFIHWAMMPGVTYRLRSSGIDREIQSPYDLRKDPAGYYAVCAVNGQGFESDLSNAVLHTLYERRYEAEDFARTNSVQSKEKGYSGKGYVADFRTDPANLSIEIDVPERGDYILRFTGANGHGPHGTFCAIRSLIVDGKDTGTIFIEAPGKWDEWIHSNHIILRSLEAGKHIVSLLINPENRGFDNNMSFNKQNANDCLIDYLTVAAIR